MPRRMAFGVRSMGAEGETRTKSTAPATADVVDSTAGVSRFRFRSDGLQTVRSAPQPQRDAAEWLSTDQMGEVIGRQAGESRLSQVLTGFARMQPARPCCRAAESRSNTTQRLGGVA